MNVLHLSYRDNAGGSGRAAYRLHRSLQARGVNSRMLVSRKNTRDASVQLVSFGLLKKVDELFGRVTEALALESLFYPSSFLLPVRPWFREADVIQIYNTHGHYFSHTAFPLLSRRPLVWRLSDMWAFTGHCAYSYECARWKTGCGQCPHLENPYPLARDTTALLWRIKKFVYQKSRLTIVVPSTWMEECVRQSPLLGHCEVVRIPNGLDTDVFRPIDRHSAREVLDLPRDRPIILFGADVLSDRRKGAAYVIEALRRLPADLQREAIILLLGAAAPEMGLPEHLEIRNLGFISDDRLMAIAYSAADLVVSATIADNLPNVILESMACGTPVVAFDTGGVGDAVRSGQTGFLADFQSSESLAMGMETLLRNAEERLRLGRNSRALIEEEFTLARQAERFMEVYGRVSKGDSSSA